MPRAQAIATDYTAYDDANFVMMAGGVLDGLRHNADYPAPPWSLGQVQGLLDQLSGAALAGRAGRPGAEQQRAHVRAQAEAALAALSAYATAATPDRPDLWASANFPLTRAAGPLSQPVTGLTLTPGPTPGTLAAHADAQAGMCAYAWRVFLQSIPRRELAAGFCYRLHLTAQPQALLTDLTGGLTYGVACAAWNDTADLQWSPPAFCRVR